MTKKIAIGLTLLLCGASLFAQTKECEYFFEPIPGAQIKMGKTEVTQDLYYYVMGQNPSEFEGNKLPVENVSWFDAIVFCNKLSRLEGLDPVYSVNGSTNVEDWSYVPHSGSSIEGIIIQLASANGYRLPSNDEWKHAAKGGKPHTYSGSNDIDAVGWSVDNSNRKTHTVASKAANGYGLYDMSGNVWEWTWTNSNGYAFYQGGSWSSATIYCSLAEEKITGTHEYKKYNNLGFRICAFDGSLAAARKQVNNNNIMKPTGRDNDGTYSSDYADIRVSYEPVVVEPTHLDNPNFDVSVMTKLRGSLFKFDETGWGVITLNEWAPSSSGDYFWKMATKIDDFGGAEIWCWSNESSVSSYNIWFAPISAFKFTMGYLDEHTIAFPQFGDWASTVTADGYGYKLDIASSAIKISLAAEGGAGAYWMDIANQNYDMVGKFWGSLEFGYDIGAFQFFAAKNALVGAHGFSNGEESDLAIGLAVNFMPYKKSGVYFDGAATFDYEDGAMSYKRIDAQIGGQYYLNRLAFQATGLIQYADAFKLGGEVLLQYSINNWLNPYIDIDAYDVMSASPALNVSAGTTATFGDVEVDMGVYVPIDFSNYQFKIDLPVTVSLKF